jgi:HPt (histidine-containing phosphotransfer) domain-containing protein
MADCVGKPFTSQELWRCLVKFLPVSDAPKRDGGGKSGGDTLLNRISIEFYEKNQQTYKNIINAIGDNDMKTAHRLAHTLKGNAAQINENRLRNAAAAIEAALTNGGDPPTETQLNTLEFELKKTLEKLGDLYKNKEEEVVNKLFDADKARKVLEALEPMLVKKNPGCEDLLGDIRQIPGAEELVRLVADFEFEQAAGELAKIKEGLVRTDDQGQ